MEIRDRRRRQLIAVIELLSPSNKNLGDDRNKYLGKREQILASTAHLVEIDLLRGGPRLPLEDMPVCDYCVLVARHEERPRVGIWPIGLRAPLPVIPVPLAGGDPDAKLDLQAALHEVYDRARYGSYIYQDTPMPPLDHTTTTILLRNLLCVAAQDGIQHCVEPHPACEQTLA